VVPLDPPLEPLRYTLARSAVELEFAPVEFIQVNGAVTRPWWKRAADLLQLDSTSTLLDLYCGLGNFTWHSRARPGRAVGVEATARSSSVPRQRPSQRHRQRRISPRQPRDTTRRGACVDAPELHHVLLDPPRTGAPAVLAALAALAPQRLVLYFLSPGSLGAIFRYWCTSTASRCRRRV